MFRMDIREPIKYEIIIEGIGEGKWKMLYKEYFKPEDLEAFKNSAELLNALPLADLGMSKSIVNEEEHSVTNEVVTEKEKLMDYLAGEFLIMSSLGKMTLREIMIATAIAAPYMPKPPGRLIPTHPPKVRKIQRKKKPLFKIEELTDEEVEELQKKGEDKKEEG